MAIWVFGAAAGIVIQKLASQVGVVQLVSVSVLKFYQTASTAPVTKALPLLGVQAK